MVTIRIATQSDVEKPLDCYVEIWQSLRECLPDSFINPAVESIRNPEGIERFRQGMDSVDGIYLVAEQNKEIVGLPTGREHGGVANTGFLDVEKQHRRKGIAAAPIQIRRESRRKKSSQGLALHGSTTVACDQVLHQQRLRPRRLPEKTYSWFGSDNLQQISLNGEKC